MATFDNIISGGFVIDGTGLPGVYADVGIVGGVITKIGNLTGEETKQRIDAKGKIVAPGFITQHTHYDASLFWDPYCLDAGHNGVTTVVNANCGFGFAPVRKENQERIMGMMETTEQIPVHHQKTALPWDWESYPDFMNRIRSLPKGVNVLTFLPLNPLLVYVMGIDGAKTRAPNAKELAELHRLINEAMDAGAIGISMSVMGAEGNTHVDTDGTSMPTDSMDHDAILDICKAVTNRGEGVIQMISQIMYYGDRSITKRIAELAKGTRVRVIHNVFLTHDLVPQKVEEDLAWLEELRDDGCDVTVGALVNRGWVESSIRQLDAVAGNLAPIRDIIACKSDAEAISLLKDTEFIKRFHEEYTSAVTGNPAASLEGQTVISVGDNADLKTYIGKTLGEISEETGQNVVEVLAELGVKSYLALQLKSLPVSATTPDQAHQLMAHPAVVCGGSDGGAHTKVFGMGHYGTDLLIWMVREHKLRSLEDMHFQLSLKHARSVQIEDRGALLPGFKADILIYNLDNLYFDMEKYEIVHDMPEGDWRRQARAGGYDMILVNGEITHQNDQSTGATPGEFVQVTQDLGGSRMQAAE
ncbi:MAG: amidohydrolase family protein [Parvularculales bacterium]